MTNADRKAAAEELYMSGRYSQEKVAVYVGVSSQTMSKWVNDGEWKEKLLKGKRLQQNTADRIYNIIQHQLQVIEQEIEKQRGGGDLKSVDKGEIDALSKLFSAVKQKELSFTQQIVLLTDFLEFSQKQNMTLAKQIAPLIELYIATKRQEEK